MGRLRDAVQYLWNEPFWFLRVYVTGDDTSKLYDKARWIEPLMFMQADPEGLDSLQMLSTKPSDIYTHLPTLYRTITDRHLRTILELGTRGGDSTLALLMGARDIGGHVTSVDLDPCLEARARVEQAHLGQFFTFIQSDDLVVDWTQPIHFLFIDTSHTYAQTLKELERFEPLVATGGFIALHDTTGRPQVWRAVREYFVTRRDVTIFRYMHNHGLAVIEKRSPSLQSNQVLEPVLPPRNGIGLKNEASVSQQIADSLRKADDVISSPPLRFTALNSNGAPEVGPKETVAVVSGQGRKVGLPGFTSK